MLIFVNSFYSSTKFNCLFLEKYHSKEGERNVLSLARSENLATGNHDALGCINLLGNVKVLNVSQSLAQS